MYILIVGLSFSQIPFPNQKIEMTVAHINIFMIAQIRILR
jgi:hypothetical protein